MYYFEGKMGTVSLPDCCKALGCWDIYYLSVLNGFDYRLFKIGY